MLSLLQQTLITTTLALLFTCEVYANTEKTIFLGPPTVNIPSAHPSLEDLQVHTLTPDDGSGQQQIRTYLEASFPSYYYPHGKPAWLVLDDLAEGQRYEVRVCWAATQPTVFKLDTYELSTVFEAPELMSELSDYSFSRQPGPNEIGDGSQLGKASRTDIKSERESSVLFLRILAAADYYTTNKTLMNTVPPVYVDIILDPFILNILPQSLVPTVGYIIVVAILSCFVARLVSTRVRHVAAEPGQKKDQ